MHAAGASHHTEGRWNRLPPLARPSHVDEPCVRTGTCIKRFCADCAAGDVVHPGVCRYGPRSACQRSECVQRAVIELGVYVVLVLPEFIVGNDPTGHQALTVAQRKVRRIPTTAAHACSEGPGLRLRVIEEVSLWRSGELVIPLPGRCVVFRKMAAYSDQPAIGQKPLST